MKKTDLSATVAALVPPPVALPPSFRRTRTRLFAVAISLASVTQVFSQPIITNQPQSRTNVAGTTATFSVIATGAPPLSYQWVLNSLVNRLPGATNDTLVVTNVQAGNAGNYRVVITNDSGSVLSASARLTVVFPPVITNQPVSLVGFRGYPVTFKVGAGGTALLSYQWYFNDTGLLDQTNALLTLPSVSDLNTGNYSVTVSNPYGGATSRVARLTIDRSAQVVVVPNTLATNDGNSFVTSPTGGPTSVREMTIYDASQFGELSGPSFLTQFAWRPDTTPGPSGPRSLTLRIYASTTSRSAAGISTTFAENHGANHTLVFDGPLIWATANLPGPGNTRQFDVVFPFTTPFLYDPAAGNLVLEMQFSANGESIRVDTVSGNLTINKVVNTSSSAATTGGFGVPQVTQFTFRTILSVRQTETNTVLISWPAPSTGFELQQNDDPGTDNWMAVGTAPATVGSEKQVIVPSLAGPRFYRLRKP
jgi:hypothetical protein